MIDPTFRNINRLLVLSFKNGDNDATRNVFVKRYMPLVEIKDFNILIDNKQFLINLQKINKKRMKKLVEMSRGNDYTTGKLLDYLYHQNYYKLIGTDLSRQRNTTIPLTVNLQEN